MRHGNERLSNVRIRRRNHRVLTRWCPSATESQRRARASRTPRERQTNSELWMMLTALIRRGHHPAKPHELRNARRRGTIRERQQIFSLHMYHSDLRKRRCGDIDQQLRCKRSLHNRRCDRCGRAALAEARAAVVCWCVGRRRVGGNKRARYRRTVMRGRVVRVFGRRVVYRRVVYRRIVRDPGVRGLVRRTPLMGRHDRCFVRSVPGVHPAREQPRRLGQRQREPRTPQGDQCTVPEGTKCGSVPRATRSHP